MENKIKKDLAIMRILKTNELRYHIGTNERHASIDLVITKENPEYHFFLDASPLEKEDNDKMLEIYNLK